MIWLARAAGIAGGILTTYVANPQYTPVAFFGWALSVFAVLILFYAADSDVK